MSKSTFTILFYARKNQVNRMGKAGIMIRVSVNGESVQFSSKLDIEPELWDATNQKMIGTTKAAREFNALLDDIRTSLRNHYREIEKYEAYVTAEKVRNAFLGITVRQLPHPVEESRPRLPDRRRIATHPSKEDAVYTAGTGTRRIHLFVLHGIGLYRRAESDQREYSHLVRFCRELHCTPSRPVTPRCSPSHSPANPAAMHVRRGLQKQ